MPARNREPSQALQPGASTEQVLSTMLPVVVGAAAQSAEGALAAANAVKDLSEAVSANTAGMAALTAKVDEHLKASVQADPHPKWLQWIFQPHIIGPLVIQLLILLLLGLGQLVPGSSEDKRVEELVQDLQELQQQLLKVQTQPQGE